MKKFFRIIMVVGALIEISNSQESLSSSDKVKILNFHNSLRGMVNPTASNMEGMVWSEELAQVAQNYAEGCRFMHNPNRTSQQSTFQSVGENLAATAGAANYTSLVLSWYNEVNDYYFTSNTCSHICGHYTQVVWATSNTLGCGARRCSQLAGFVANALFLVCNYGPAGNFAGQSPYMLGSPCSNCPVEKPYCSNNICVMENPMTGSPNGDSTTETGNDTEVTTVGRSSQPSIVFTAGVFQTCFTISLYINLILF